MLQGIYTHINKPLKSVLKNKYRDFMRNGEVEYTSGGNKKGPSYQLLVDWCSQPGMSLTQKLSKGLSVTQESQTKVKWTHLTFI